MLLLLSCVGYRDDAEWYMAESLITGQRGFIPFNFVATTNTMETEPYVIQEICTPFHTLYNNHDTPFRTRCTLVTH